MIDIKRLRTILTLVVTGCLVTVGVTVAGPVTAGTVGVITEYSSGLTAGALGGIAAGPDGNLWFTELTGDRIGRINPARGRSLSSPAGMTAGARPSRDRGRPGRQPVVHRGLREPDRADHPGQGSITEFSSGMISGPARSGSRPALTATCGSPSTTGTGSGGSPRPGSITEFTPAA